ncbi:MAG: hypothetical protein R3F34_16895 [Planctomycetota bacterium]
MRSAAVPQDDPQVAEARRRGVPVLKYAEIPPKLVQADRLLAVAGTHGKTTTSWLLNARCAERRTSGARRPARSSAVTDLAHRRYETCDRAGEERLVRARGLRVRP